MNRPTKTEVPKHLFLAVMISVGITVTVSVSYTILSILGLVYRYQCDEGNVEAIYGADYFINTVYRVYIQSDSCNNTLIMENLTREHSVFVLNILTLCASVLCCVAAIVVLSVMLSEKKSQLYLACYVYVALCCSSLVVDLTFATHFGLDYSYLTEQLNLSNAGLALNYSRDVIRLGALFLMTICLKGFVASFINCVLFGLIIFYIGQHKGMQKKEEHSIHKLGALNAYNQPRRQDPWQSDSQMFYRGSQMNPAYIEDTPPPRSPRREPSSVHTDYSRPDAWKSSGVSSAGSRPFSYLEEPKWGAPAQARGSPPVEAWARAPPVPAPDYSPLTPRRLKPALKPY